MRFDNREQQTLAGKLFAQVPVQIQTTMGDLIMEQVSAPPDVVALFHAINNASIGHVEQPDPEEEESSCTTPMKST